MTVSAASVNTRPTTGIKFPVTNFAVRIVIPSATADVAPWTDSTPKKQLGIFQARQCLYFSTAEQAV